MKSLTAFLKYRPWILGALGLCAFGSVATAAPEPNPRHGWEMLARYSAASAALDFDPETTGDTPEKQLGRAAVYLGKYPQTPQNVDRATELLEALISQPERSDYQAAGYYLLARIEHIFMEGREEQAAVYYRKLRSAYPENRLADNAAVKLALLQLHALPPDVDDATVGATIAQLERPVRKSTLSDFHQVVAAYLLERGELAAALNHLLAAQNLRVVAGKNRADLLVQVGRVATLVKQPEAALAAYLVFIKEFPSDTRNYMVNEELRKLEEARP